MKKVLVSKKQKMIVRVLSLFLLVFSILALGSCSTAPSFLLPDHKPTEGSGYVYGRFYVFPDEEGTWHIDFGDSFIRIIVENIDNSKKHSFWIAKETNAYKGAVTNRPEIPDHEIQIIEVPPGNYRINSIELRSRESIPETKDFNMDGYKKDFVVEANTAVYIGDFTGKISRDYNIIAWALSTAVNNYEKTTIGALERYPFLKEAGITFVSNMMTISNYDEPTLVTLERFPVLTEARITLASNIK